jgi:hypothetical protein
MDFSDLLSELKSKAMPSAWLLGTSSGICGSIGFRFMGREHVKSDPLKDQ